jgi:hypothetical protein
MHWYFIYFKLIIISFKKKYLLSIFSPRNFHALAIFRCSPFIRREAF